MGGGRRALSILVVGAGLGGLGAGLALKSDGHHVIVVDSVPEFAEASTSSPYLITHHPSTHRHHTHILSQAGAGIRLPPNSSRLLSRWGVDLANMKKSTSSGYEFVRWQDGSSILHLPFDSSIDHHGAPYYLVHRADLHAALLSAAVKAGVQVLPNKRIVAYDFSEPSAVTDQGEVFTADLIIASDGIKSLARPLLTGREDRPRDTGDVAYRILISGDRIRADPELANLITSPRTTSWCGPDAHIVGYPIRDGELYNLVVCAKSRLGETSDEAWVVRGDNSELCTRFAGWEPRVRKLCALTGDFLKWRLCDLGSLSTWCHPSGKAVLLGDACHPMLPYLAQGAAQAFEDAGVLRQILAQETRRGSSSSIGSGSSGSIWPGSLSLSQALAVYEKIRMPRTRLVQEKTREHQYILHIADGEAQRQRDKLMREDADKNPVFWGHRERRQWLFGHDAENLAKDGANWNMKLEVVGQPA